MIFITFPSSLKSRGLWIGTIVLVGLTLYVVFSPGAQAWLLNWSEVLSGLGSVMLTAALVILYYQQKELLAAEQMPVVEVEEVRPDDEALLLFLSNVGKGVAADFELVTVSVFPETEYSGPGIARTKLHRHSPNSEIQRRGRSLRPSEDRVIFRARPTVGIADLTESFSVDSPTAVQYPNGVMKRHGFGTEQEELSRASVDVLRYHFYIRYRDLLGNWHIQQFKSLECEPSTEPRSIEEIFERAAPMLWGQPEVTADTLRFDLETAEQSNERTVV